MHVAALPLLAGRYLLSAAVYDKTMLLPYDHHDRIYHFAVHKRRGKRTIWRLRFRRSLVMARGVTS
jgi:hypothetical protein